MAELIADQIAIRFFPMGSQGQVTGAAQRVLHPLRMDRPKLVSEARVYVVEEPGTTRPVVLARIERLWLRQVGELRLFQGIPCAAAFADLYEVVIRGQFLHMHFDGVAVRPRRILYFLDRDLVAGLGELQYLARKGGQGRSQGLLLLDLGSKLVFLLRHGFEEKHEPIFPVLPFLTDGLLGLSAR